MRDLKNNYYLKGFTLVELLIALILTSLAITFSFTTLSYIQKIFISYKDQNRFINEYCRLKNVLENEVRSSDVVITKATNEFSILRDSTITDILLEEKRVLLKRLGFCDTFHFAPLNTNIHFESTNNPAWMNRLVKSLSFELKYNKQKFNFSFYKNYDASVKMKLDLTNDGRN